MRTKNVFRKHCFFNYAIVAINIKRDDWLNHRYGKSQYNLHHRRVDNRNTQIIKHSSPQLTVRQYNYQLTSHHKCCVVLSRVVWFCVMLHCVVLCCVVLYCVVLCCVVL